MRSRNIAGTAISQLSFSANAAKGAANRPAIPLLSTLIMACFTLVACGESTTSGADSSMASGQDAEVEKIILPPGASNDPSGQGADGSGEAGSMPDADGDPNIGEKAVTALAPPTMSKAPAFSVGTVAVGSASVRGIGEYPGGTPIAGRRYRNNILIPGATAASYTVVAADAGQQLVYEELVERNDNKVRKWFRSAAVTPGAPTASKSPSLGVGPFAVGQASVRVMGEYPGSTPVAGRRYRNNVLIPGATGASYTITAADAGHELVYEEQAEHNQTKVRVWFRSAPVKIAGVVTDTVPLQPQASGALNTLDTVINDLGKRNDFVLKGYESRTDGWYVQGETHMGNDPRFSNSPTWSIFYNNPSYAGMAAKALLPWLVVFDGVDHASTNSAVEMRNMRTYVKARSTGKWTLMGGPAGVAGVYYSKPSLGNPAKSEVLVSSYATGTVVKVPANGWFWHGWWKAGRVAINPNDIEAVFVTVQARQVVADTAMADDRAKAQLGLQVGADYYLTTTMAYSESYAPAVGIARTKKITNDWQAFSYVTLSDVGSQNPGGGITQAALRAAPPPLE